MPNKSTLNPLHAAYHIIRKQLDGLWLFAERKYNRELRHANFRVPLQQVTRLRRRTHKSPAVFRPPIVPCHLIPLYNALKPRFNFCVIGANQHRKVKPAGRSDLAIPATSS
jgi:hypothetical protein